MQTEAIVSHHGHVLVIDDEPEVLALTSAVLRAGGHTVQTYATADEAVDAARTSDFDAVVADIHLGSDNGLALCGRLIATRPAMPVVVVTGTRASAWRSPPCVPGPTSSSTSPWIPSCSV